MAKLILDDGTELIVCQEELLTLTVICKTCGSGSRYRVVKEPDERG
jgi:RNase P subunit RPR2